MAKKNKNPGKQPSVPLSAATAQSFQTAQPTEQQPTNQRPTNQQPTNRQPKPRAHRTGWLYKDVDRQTCLRTIEPISLALCDQPVTSDGETSVLGTFCWTPEKAVRIPGREPVFQDVALPAVLPPAPSLRAAARITPKASRRRGKNGAGAKNANNNNNINTMPPHTFAPLAQAIATMSPSYRLRGTDLVAQRNSLRKLFALCAGRSPESFRVGLHLVGNTLVVTKYDRFAWHPGVTRASGVGLSFEQMFTKAPPGREGDQAHHRVISYRLGDLSCVVQFEADACYQQAQETKDQQAQETEEQLQLLAVEKMRLLTLEPPAAPPMADDSPAPQSTMAEMKTGNNEGKLAGALPQLWFGRTPWFIQGRREGDTVTAVKVTRAASRFASWEERNQTALRRLVTLVHELRDSIKAGGPGGRHCVLVYDRAARGEPGVQPRVVHVYKSNFANEPIPEDMVERLWGPN